MIFSYCECFAADVYYVEPCSCQERFNKPIHEDTVLATRKQIESRNPLAFAPEVIKTSDSLQEDESSTPVSARRKRGCNNKKSGCLKKYRECYQGFFLHGEDCFRRQHPSLPAAVHFEVLIFVIKLFSFFIKSSLLMLITSIEQC